MLSSQLHLHELPHFLCRFLLHFPRHMGIGIQCESGGVVAQHPGERLNVDTVLEGHGGKSMPQIMKTAVLQSSVPKDSLVDSCHGLRAWFQLLGKGTDMDYSDADCVPGSVDPLPAGERSGYGWNAGSWADSPPVFHSAG